MVKLVLKHYSALMHVFQTNWKQACLPVSGTFSTLIFVHFCFHRSGQHLWGFFATAPDLP